MSQWIKCSDRLPDIGKSVLVCNPGGEVETGRLHADECKPDGYYWAIYLAFIDSAEFGDVQYWMPLPPPPEAQP